MSAATKQEVEYLRAQAVAAEQTLGGKQVCWASTPRDVPTLRRKTILFSGTLGARRQYAFAAETDRELFVYDRYDTLFTVSRDIRAQLGLTPPLAGGTRVIQPPQEQAAPAPAGVKKRFRK